MLHPQEAFLETVFHRMLHLMLVLVLVEATVENAVSRFQRSSTYITLPILSRWLHNQQIHQNRLFRYGKRRMARSR
jgi:hypothetical protein